MEFRKMIMITLYARQQKRHRCIVQSFGLWEKARVGWSERTPFKHIYYHTWNRSPVQVPRMRQGAQGWCTGMTQTDGMGRELGGEPHVYPWLFHVNVWQKPLQYCKVISLQLKKIQECHGVPSVLSSFHRFSYINAFHFVWCPPTDLYPSKTLNDNFTSSRDTSPEIRFPQTPHTTILEVQPPLES